MSSPRCSPVRTTIPVRRVVLDLRGWRASLAGQLAEVAGDLQMCRTLMGFAAGLGLNAEIVGEKLQEFAATSLDPELSVVSADLERGVRVVGDLYHAPDSRACVMGAKDIALASRVPCVCPGLVGVGWAERRRGLAHRA